MGYIEELRSLDSLTAMPVEHIVGGILWGEDKYVIPDNYEAAPQMLNWDGNRTLFGSNKRISKVSDKVEKSIGGLLN